MLDAEAGELTSVHTAAGRFFAGASVVPGRPDDQLFTFEVNFTDHVVRYDLASPGMPSSTYQANILQFFNAGRGDLATAFAIEPEPYCTAGTTTNGCHAQIAATNNPDVAHSSGCVVTFAGVEGQKAAIVFYGLSAASPSPWCAGGSSFLCVKAPTQRMSVQSAGGTAGACDGVLSEDWDAFQLANPLALGQPWSADANAYVQGWFRDPPACKTTNLSNALELTYVP